MLRGLSIHDMLLIDGLELLFQPGLNVLTGETGAGKSILLDMLGFVLGWRVPGGVLQQSGRQGEVIAEFELAPGHPARAVLEEAGLAQGDSLIVRRTVTGSGRRQAFVNDRRCTSDTLRGLGAALVEIHGQHDDRGLLDAAGHRGLLDMYADNGERLSATRAAWRQVSGRRKQLADLVLDLEKAEQEREYLSHALKELDQLAPQDGEADRLDARRRLMKAGARIREDIARAATALGPQGAEGQIGDAMAWLHGVEQQAQGRLGDPIAALSRAFEEIATAAQGIDDCLDALSADPTELERVEERLFAIRALARKHSVLPDDLGPLSRDLQRRLSALDHGKADIETCKAALAGAEAEYLRCAGELGKRRRKAAARLDASMASELPPLKLERARFLTGVNTAEPGPEGTDTVRFTVATNPGLPPGPIGKIASGGELSRFLLALKVCLSTQTGGQTMIFDEIDRGVGGATADAVGRRLAALAGGAQILVVTHSPQVAARAAHHFRVEKIVANGETQARVAPLGARDRIDELARMLAGDRITNEARAAAKVLLAR
ncbi:MAG: DNA repair protein RecN [Paracoccaceae bacterium]